MNSPASVAVRVTPNSAACLAALMKSRPVEANAITFAPDDCACSKYEEKSVVPSGCRTDPATVPPRRASASVVSRSSAAPNA